MKSEKQEMQLMEDKSIQFVAFKSRHLNEDIEGISLYEEIYGKDKVRTLHVLLVLCLHLAVDPPDILTKISPCAKIEAWFDPREKNVTRALEMIGKNLQSQYERWQPKARYRQSLDPTIDEVHRLCQNLRRSARDERVLFHYNGHGVPRPTENGEIWVFNKTYTKYIPLSLLDLQNWMSGPSVYVFDCNNAGRIIRMMEAFASKKQDPSSNVSTSSNSMENNIILAACQENEDIPQNPEIPADLFTACLTTPIKIALKWYLLRHNEIFPGHLNESMLDLISGSPSNRVSMFGEVNWVFTAVTDTIAWSCLPPVLFQRLFRQDLLVASLFRNFLLAERIMHHYGVRPVSYPSLPKTYEHPMWHAWDHALDFYVSQLPDIMRKREEFYGDTGDENLPIIPHPPDDPPNSMANIGSCESSEDDEDEIDDEEDEKVANFKLDGSKLVPRNILLNEDIQEIINTTTDQYYNNRNVEIMKNDNAQLKLFNKTDVLNQAWDDSMIMKTNIANNKNPANLLGIAKNAKLPCRPIYQNVPKQSKTIAPPKNNNINPLNGPSIEYIQFKHTEFFNDHMTAFELWLKTADEKKPVPIQLPILLQVLLSQVHRFRALRLISEYMDLGPSAVINCLTVGIFPYVVRLLQSPVSDVKPYLVFIWGKIISSAQTDFAKNDVVKDAGYKYFVSCLTENENYEIIIKTIAAFALAKMLNNNPAGQKLYIKQNFMTVLIEELDNNPPELANDHFIRLRIWFILCFAKLWSENDEAKWYGIRQKIHDRLFEYLKDVNPEVRAATVYALGTLLNNKANDGVRSKHAIQVDQTVCQHLLNNSVYDSSPLVRAELVVAMKYMVNLFSSQILSMFDCQDDNFTISTQTQDGLPKAPPSPMFSQNFKARRGSVDLSKLIMRNQVFIEKNNYRQKTVSNGDISNIFQDCEICISGNFLKPGFADQASRGSFMSRAPSVSNFSAQHSGVSSGNIYYQMCQGLLILTHDPSPKVSDLACKIVSSINTYKMKEPQKEYGNTLTVSTDVGNLSAISPKSSRSPVQTKNFPVKHSVLYPTHKHKVDYITGLVSADKLPDKADSSNDEGPQFDFSSVTTDFFNWASKYFTQPLLPYHKLTHKHKTSNVSLNDLPKLDIRPRSYSFCRHKVLDKVSYRKLPNLTDIDQKNLTANRGLLHLIDVAKHEDRAYLVKKQEQLRTDGSRNWSSVISSSTGIHLSQVFLQKIESKPELMKFHPYLNYLAVTDKYGVSLWNWESGHRAQYMISQSLPYREESEIEQMSENKYITSLEFINSEEERGGLLLVGTSDGRIKIWRNYLRDMGQDPEIVTAWYALPDTMYSNRPSGLITHWSQPLGQLTYSGDVKYIRLWDSVQESKVVDLNTNCDSCVTTIDRCADGRLVFAGFGDGSVRMFDIRAPTNECCFKAGIGDSGWIYKVGFSDPLKTLYSIGSHGDLVKWDLKFRTQNKAPVTTKKLFMKMNVEEDGAYMKAQNRHGLLKDHLATDLKVSLIKSQISSLKLQTVQCADFRVSSDNDKDHLAIIGYGRESRGIITANASTGFVSSNFKFLEGFSRPSIENPLTVCVHPHQTLVGAGLEDSYLLLLKLQAR